MSRASGRGTRRVACACHDLVEAAHEARDALPVELQMARAFGQSESQGHVCLGT
jgi:hypothetical protein